MTFDLRLWPSSSLNVTFIFIIRWTLNCCVLVPSTKFVGPIEFEICIWTYGISFWSNIKKLRYKVGKLTDNCEEKMGITFNRVSASAVSNHLAKTASKLKSVHLFGWNFVHKKSGHTDTQTDRHTHTQTNCSENITPPRFRGGVIDNNYHNELLLIVYNHRRLIIRLCT